MKKAISFLKRHRYWVNMALGSILAMIALKLGIGGLGLLAMISPGGELAAGVILLMFAARLFGMAFDIGDEANYRRHYERTGDDFEHRYAGENEEGIRYVPLDEKNL